VQARTADESIVRRVGAAIRRLMSSPRLCGQR
jgi:hypothetical protein